MIKARIKQLAERIDRLSLRERALLLLGVVAVIYTAWHELLMAPLGAQQDQLAQQRETLQTEVQALNTEAEQLAAAHSKDPNAPLRQEAERLQGRIEALDERLAALTVNLIGPKEMARVLEDALRRQEGLTLVRVESLGAEPIALGRAEGNTENDETRGAASGEATRTPAGAERPIYRHGVLLRFEGTYGRTQAYLQALESLSWRFFWDSVDYEVGDYPKATVTVRVHTLSLDEGWIGV